MKMRRKRTQLVVIKRSKYEKLSPSSSKFLMSIEEKRFISPQSASPSKRDIGIRKTNNRVDIINFYSTYEIQPIKHSTDEIIFSRTTPKNGENCKLSVTNQIYEFKREKRNSDILNNGTSKSNSDKQQLQLKNLGEEHI